MTNIEILQAINTEQNPLYWTKQEQNTAIENAVEALEKQIPKALRHHPWVGIDGVPYDLCPTCKNNLCTTGMLANKKTKYCPECGQKLKWDDC